MLFASVLCSASLLSPQAVCDNTSTGIVPLNDLGSGLYLGQFEGGLYPGGSNDAPAAHALEGNTRGAALRPLDVFGNPDLHGRVVVVSIGMSTTTQEFCSSTSFPPCEPWSFMGQALGNPGVDPRVVLVNGAFTEQVTEDWESPTDPNYDRIRDVWLNPAGMSELQVQVAWVKLINAFPSISLPSLQADAYALFLGLTNVVRALKTRYPNMQQVFFSSRHYGGYVFGPSNPEPFAFETGFSVKWLIEAQIAQMAGGGVNPVLGDLGYDGAAPWLAWGPYLWADGLTPRSDGLIWECSDYESDGLHPSPTGEAKVADRLLDFLLASPFSEPWFARHHGGRIERSPFRLR